MATLSKRALLLVVGVLAAGCDPAGSVEGSAVSLHGEQDVLPGFEYSTGLQPEGSPVQASFELSATGKVTVDAKAQASGSSSEPELTGVKGSGSLTVSGGFAMIGELKIDITGLPSYDGPIPGIENVDIAFEGTTPFDPFSVGTKLTSKAAIPPTKLPPIPLPGGIPGSLVLEVAEGSFVEVGFTGTCAAIGSDTASYQGDVERGGSLVIKPSIEIEVPFTGTQTFEIPSFTVPVSLGASSLSMSTPVTEYSDSIEGDKAKVGSCTATGEGGSSGDGGAAMGGGSAEGGHTGEGGGGGTSGCGIEVTFGAGNEDLDACTNESCCAEITSCTSSGQDVAGCNACLQSGGADPQCAGLYECTANVCLGVYQVCDSGWYADETCSDCLGSSCCDPFNQCNFDDLCVDCLMNGNQSSCEASSVAVTISNCIASCGC